MPDIALNTATLKAAVTVPILLLAIYNFIREKIPPDLTALLALLALLITGISNPKRRFPVSVIRQQSLSQQSLCCQQRLNAPEG